MPASSPARQTIIVVGGGVSGTLFALHAVQRPGIEVVLVEKDVHAGRGLAYGFCDPVHLLNVPVARMEVGLKPAFTDWLKSSGLELSEALEEAGGTLAAAFVPRGYFGAYLAERTEAALADPQVPLTRLRGEVVEVAEKPHPGVLLADGRRIEGTHVVLATGNLAPKVPGGRDGWFYETPRFVPDPWRWEGFSAVDPAAPILLIGTGLTMVDVALKLEEAGHRGPLVAVSRHGLLPRAHKAGGAFEPFLTPEKAPSPRTALRLLRGAAARAAAAGIPWQRVMDEARPALAAVWSSWPLTEKARFLRHGRAYWEVHRHRMAPRIAARLEALLAGRLEIIAGRIAGYTRAEGGVSVTVRPRGTTETRSIGAAYVVNCTGPRSDLGQLGIPVFARLREAGRLLPDPLGLGIETQNGAVVDRFGGASDWLFALGPLTKPAWWEITAVPEISVQVQFLAGELARRAAGGTGEPAQLLREFVNLGEGI